MKPESDRTYYDDDAPDPALVWRWIGKATRPVIGWILLGLAAIFILVGWIGVSGTPIVAKQIPYVVSGGIAGVLLAIAGAYFLATEELRKDSGRLDRLERMVQELHETLLAMSDAPNRQEQAASAERAGTNGAGFVALAGSETYHRPDCAMVAAKQNSSVLAPSTIRRRQMAPCSLCEPALLEPRDSLTPVDYVQIIVTGIFAGSVYAIGGAGIVLTYKATGVFNLAHFTIGLFAAYVLWQLNGVWGIPLWISAPLVLLVLGPGIGILLERFVFRSLQRRRASTSEKLVANLGVLVLFLGLVNVIWGAEVRGTRKEPVPRLWPQHSFSIAGIDFDSTQLAFFVAVVLVSVALWVLLRFTFLGTKIQAVVDRRELAELNSIDANRVAMVAWAIGCGLAALTGVLLASRDSVLEPIRIVFFGIEMIGVAVVARLVSLPVAILSGLLLFGATHDLLDSFDPFGDSGLLHDLYRQLVGNWSVVLLFVALVAYKTLDEVGESAPTGQGLVAADISRGRRALRPSNVLGVLLVAAGAIALPMFLTDINMTYAQQMVGLLIIFASIVCITGFSGHITLGQASIAGLGAYFTARAVNSLHVPVIVGMLIGAGVAMLAGLIAGFPALKRKGLFLGLTTLGLGLLIDRLVFNSNMFAGNGSTGLVVRRPSLFGIGLESQKAFYYFALVVAALCLLFANNLRSGRLGRLLGAMRDSETAAKAVGVDLRRYKLFIFACSSFIAGLGGAILTMADNSWDPTRFNPIFSLFWFVAITVAGISSLGGAVLAAVIFVMLPLVIGQDIQAAVFFLGVAALFLGRLPGGLIGLVRRVPRAATAAATKEYMRVQRAQREPEPEPEPLRPTAFAQSLVGRTNGHGPAPREEVTT